MNSGDLLRGLIMMENKKRFYNLDNLKFLLIFCVVTGHVLQRFTGTSELARVISFFIYSFHMPAFVFISGFFSKKAVKEKRYYKIVEYFVVYSIIKMMECIGTYLEKGRCSFRFFWENGPGWYAFAMAVFFSITMFIQQLEAKSALLTALLIGLLAGLDNHLGDHFVSMRICTFYPLFLAGFYFSKEKMIAWMQIKRKYHLVFRSISTCILFLVGSLCYFKSEFFHPCMMIFRGKYGYEQMGMSFAQGICSRFFCYIFWAILIIALLGAISEKKSVFSFLGQKTMAVYIWHTIVLKIMFDIMGGKELTKLLFPEYYVIAAVVIAAIVTILCTHLFCPQNILCRQNT